MCEFICKNAHTKVHIEAWESRSRVGVAVWPHLFMLKYVFI